MGDSIGSDRLIGFDVPTCRQVSLMDTGVWWSVLGKEQELAGQEEG